MRHEPIWKVTYIGIASTAKDIDEARRRLDDKTRDTHPAFRYIQEHINDNGKIKEVWRSYKWSWWAALQHWLKDKHFT